MRSKQRLTATATITVALLFLSGCEGSFKFTPKSPPDKIVTPAWTDDFTTTQRKATRGDAEAQYQLATMYERGHLVEQNYRKAREWYGKSATQGFTPARYELGVMTMLGIGAVADKEGGVITYMKAISQGFDPQLSPCTAEYQGKTYRYDTCWGVR